MSDITPDITPAADTSPKCENCGGRDGMGQWQRRLTDDELAVELAREQARRDALTALADPQLPPPDFGPMPTAGDFVRSVYACTQHVVSLSLAHLVHQGSCSGPNSPGLPACDCTPEAPPAPEPAPDPVAGPASWT